METHLPCTDIYPSGANDVKQWKHMKISDLIWMRVEVKKNELTIKFINTYCQFHSSISAVSQIKKHAGIYAHLNAPSTKSSVPARLRELPGAVCRVINQNSPLAYASHLELYYTTCECLHHKYIAPPLQKIIIVSHSLAYYTILCSPTFGSPTLWQQTLFWRAESMVEHTKTVAGRTTIVEHTI